MDMNPLGATGLKVTRLGFGAMHLKRPGANENSPRAAREKPPTNV